MWKAKAMREDISENSSELCGCVIDTVHAVIHEVRKSLESQRKREKYGKFYTERNR